MKESKIDLTERLRREGRWAEASKYKDETVKKLRAKGMKRAEAGEQAWQRMADAFPRAEEKSAYDRATQLLYDTVRDAVDEWQKEYGITLPDDAREGLMEYVAMNFCPDPDDEDAQEELCECLGSRSRE
jgi:hypothetical protein